ncbi:CmcJ/NvfI family oxidoreductase [Streptomyces sp. A30]|uniref:CmcJ/NvfI family oxidoreductase n=1 Tax=Streptomyces sp. A30 TaxID=2789273 RepID=UPI00397F3A19
MTNTTRAAVIGADMPYVTTGNDRIELSYKDTTIDSFKVEPQEVRVRDARPLRDRLSLDTEGFLLADHGSAVALDPELIRENGQPREDVPAINDRYADELIPLIRQLSGAREVFPQYGTMQVRFSNRAAHRSWLPTSAFTHMDFVTTQVEELIQQTLRLTGREVAPYSRHCLIQTWRVITDPPQDMPLAVCDSRTTAAEDLIPLDYHGVEGSRNELLRSFAGRYAPRHEWYYFPDMTPDEVLVFKGFDSAMPEHTNVMHTAFDDTTVGDVVPRGSVECRFIALFD